MPPATDPNDPHTTIMPPLACPYCGYRLVAASRFEEVVTPRPGDISVCISCAQVIQFGYDLTLRKLTKAELDAIFAGDPQAAADVRKYQRAVLGMEIRDGRPTSPPRLS